MLPLSLKPARSERNVRAGLGRKNSRYMDTGLGSREPWPPVTIPLLPSFIISEPNIENRPDMFVGAENPSAQGTKI